MDARYNALGNPQSQLYVMIKHWACPLIYLNVSVLHGSSKESILNWIPFNQYCWVYKSTKNWPMLKFYPIPNMRSSSVGSLQCNSKKRVYTLYMGIKRNIIAVREERHVQSLTISWFCLNDRYSFFIICTIIPMSAFPGSRLLVIYNFVFLPFLYACKITQD